MTERGLRISEIEGWKTEYLELDGDSLGRQITTIDGLLQSMLIEQDDLAESWNGAGGSCGSRPGGE
ncbi:hypothetical protein [Nocardia carnea]|uniref:hypothetical protein n=1 Tax=Nocardia carnea TaxID=37328 RepID=UPI000525C079|nr:hypothetical protein [Nocardia carnea]